MDYNRTIEKSPKSLLVQLTLQMNQTELVELYQSYINLKLTRLMKKKTTTVKPTTILQKLRDHIYKPFYDPTHSHKFIHTINKNITNILPTDLLAIIMSFIENNHENYCDRWKKNVYVPLVNKSFYFASHRSIAISNIKLTNKFYKLLYNESERHRDKICGSLKYCKNIKQINFEISKSLVKCLKERITSLINPSKLQCVTFDSEYSKKPKIKWSRQYFGFITDIYANCSPNERKVMSKMKFDIYGNGIDIPSLNNLLKSFTNINSIRIWCILS